MKKISLMLMMMATFAMTSCDRTDDDDDGNVNPIGGEVKVTSAITQNTTWTANNKYILEGFIYVESGATLTIEPGTIIKGDAFTKGTLIIKPGAKIDAEGTVAKPIVFTSNKAKGSRNYGDWGGIIILGNSTVNKTDATIEGENVSKFGGNNATDNSGTLKYVRIEFAGIAFETDKEINGLTFGGVGSGTTIDYVQVSYSGDDAYEWFGGTVNAKHLVSYKNLDDDFDTDWGFSGNIQYGYILRDPSVADQCECSDSNGFESDNDGSGSDARPLTSAKFANITMVMGEGSVNAKHARAFRIRRNSAISIYNAYAVGAWTRGGLTLQGGNTNSNLINGTSAIKGVMLAGMSKPLITGSSDMSDEAAALVNLAANANKPGIDIATMLLADGSARLSGKPGLLPKTGSPLLNGGVALPSGFENNTYVGAFSTTDWTEGWTNWDPQNTDY